jgi:hypothetical protein
MCELGFLKESQWSDQNGDVKRIDLMVIAEMEWHVTGTPSCTHILEMLTPVVKPRVFVSNIKCLYKHNLTAIKIKRKILTHGTSTSIHLTKKNSKQICYTHFICYKNICKCVSYRPSVFSSWKNNANFDSGGNFYLLKCSWQRLYFSRNINVTEWWHFRQNKNKRPQCILVEWFLGTHNLIYKGYQELFPCAEGGGVHFTY